MFILASRKETSTYSTTSMLVYLKRRKPNYTSRYDVNMIIKM